MKLFLHWLLWDLRRFRWPLLAWAGLVAGFFGYIGWLHVNILSIPSWLPAYNAGIAAVIGGAELFLVLHILTTDASAGAHPFWKTRPPSGFAVAGSKVVLVLVFFFILPVLAHWLMRQAPGIDFNPREWKGRTWGQMLRWTECAALSVIFLVASGARSGSHALGRMAAGGGVLFIPVLVSMLPGWGADASAAQWMHGWFRRIHAGFYLMDSAVLWLCAGLALFVAVRRTRTPAPLALAAPLYIPALSLAAAAVIGGRPQIGPARHTVERLAPEEITRHLRIGEPRLRDERTAYHSGTFKQGSPVGDRSGFILNLRLTGLAEDRIVSAEWQEFSLTGTEGQTIHCLAAESGLAGPITSGGAQNVLPVSSVFKANEIAPFSLTSCRGKGVLRLRFLKARRQQIPIQPGQRFIQSRAVIELTETEALHFPSPNGPVMQFSVADRDGVSSPWIWLEHGMNAGLKLPLLINGARSLRGCFMHFERGDWPVYPGFEVSPVVSRLVNRAVAHGTLSDWRLHALWYEPEGIADFPVELEDVIIPLQPGGSRDCVEVISGLKISPGMTAGEVKRMAKYALSLVNDSFPQFTQSPDRDPVMLSIQQFLNTIPREKTQVLLEIAAENPLPDDNRSAPFDLPLQRRIASELDAAAAADLRAGNPQLFRYLRSELFRRQLVSSAEAYDPEWIEFTGEKLHAAWRLNKYASRSVIDTGPLVYALKRGEPWSVQEIAELADLVPEQLGQDLADGLSAVSDCPAAPANAIPWLQQNAARLTWDAAAKRWVLPQIP